MKKTNIIKNKRGWIRLVEVFVAILLLTAILITVISKLSSNYNEEKYTQIYKGEKAILKDIELNNTLRAEILSVNPPVEWENFEFGLQQVQARILYLTPSNFECEAKVCTLNGECIRNILSDNEVYAQSVIITTDLNTYSPRQLKLFCAKK